MARRRRAVRWMLVVLVPVAAATVAGLVVLWPAGGPSRAQVAGTASAPPGTSSVQGTVVAVRAHPCSGTGGGLPAQTCGTAAVRVDGDPGGVRRVELPPDAVATGVSPGLRLVLTAVPGGADGTAPGLTYQFQDIARGVPLIALSVAFVLVVAAVARWRGLAALVGLAVAFVVLLLFVLPALLAGEPPVAVALVGSAAIMFVVLYLAHGVSVRTTTALIGTLCGLSLVGGLGQLAVAAAHLTGFASEDTVQLQQFDPTLPFGGLVVAGVVVAGLGVLNDVTVTQASAVWELSEASPRLGVRELFRRGMAIGRDHIASTIYTIVFAYAGASLPLLLLYEVYRRPLGTVLTSAQVGEEVVRTLVGAIALVLAVPVTTAVGAAVAAASSSAAPAVGHPPAGR